MKMLPVLILVFASATVFADSNDVMTIELTDGQILIGTIISKTESDMEINLLKGGVVTVSGASVQSVHLATADDLAAAEKRDPGSTRRGQGLPEVRFSAGLAADYYYNGNRQQLSDGIDDTDTVWNFSSWGTSAFFDLTYVTVKLGIRNSARKAHFNMDSSLGPDEEGDVHSSLSQINWALELKYPFFMTTWLSLAPKIGWEWLSYVGGDINSTRPKGTMRDLVSPMYLTLGAELTCYVGDKIFFRPYAVLGYGPNADVLKHVPPGVEYEAKDTAVIYGVALGYVF